MKTVGFLGLGIMGRPMVQHLLQAGYRVLVYDVAREAIERVVSDGATAATPAELAKAAEFVFLCLPNGCAFRRAGTISLFATRLRGSRYQQYHAGGGQRM